MCVSDTLMLHRQNHLLVLKCKIRNYFQTNKRYQVDIPKEAYHILTNAISLADTEEFAAGILDMQKTALLLFAGYVDAATTMAESHGGGGSTPSSGWGRDRDEDEREWARRCARMAMEMSRPQRRGWRR